MNNDVVFVIAFEIISNQVWEIAVVGNNYFLDYPSEPALNYAKINNNTVRGGRFVSCCAGICKNRFELKIYAVPFIQP